MKKKMLVEGMSCQKCVAHVREALEEVGATDIQVNLTEKNAIFVVNESITDDVITANVVDFGYEVVSIENLL